MIAGIRLRAGRAGSGRGAASMLTEAIGVARAAGAAGEVLVRGDSAYGHAMVVRACQRAGAPRTTPANRSESRRLHGPAPLQRTVREGELGALVDDLPGPTDQKVGGSNPSRCSGCHRRCNQSSPGALPPGTQQVR